MTSPTDSTSRPDETPDRGEHGARLGAERLAADSERRAGLAREPGTSRRRVRYVSAMATVLLVFVSGAYVARDQGLFLSSHDRARLGLVRAVGARRLIEPRLSGGFRYGVLRTPSRVGVLEPSARASGNLASGDWNLFAEAARLKNEDSGVLAIANLLVGDIDEAVRMLEAEVSAFPGDARLLSDLAAARLHRASTQDRPDDYPKALDAAAKAVELDPNLDEAKFNLALATQSLHFSHSAVQAWQDVVEADDDEAWRQDAAQHLEALRSRPRPDFDRDKGALAQALRDGSDANLDACVKQNIGIARDVFDLELLPDPARAGQAVRLAESIRRVAHDSYAIEMTRTVGVSSLARLYDEGRKRYDKGDWTGSRPFFTELVNETGGRSPFSLWSQLFLDILLYQENTRAALPRLRDLAERSRQMGFTLVEGRARWVLALAELDAGEFDAAESNAVRAHELFSLAGHDEWATFMLSQQAEILSFLADDEGSARLRMRAFARMDQFRDPLRVRATLLSASDFFIEIGAPRASLVALEEIAAREPGNPASTTPPPNLARHRARAFVAMGRMPPAEVIGARTNAQAVIDPIWRKREAQETQIDLAGVGDDSPTDLQIRIAIDAVKARGNDPVLPALYRDLGAALLAKGDTEASLEAVREGLRALESPKPLRAELALTANDRGWDLYGLQIEALQKSGAAPQQTLAAADRAWRNALGSLRFQPNGSESLSPSFAELQPHQAIVGYFDNGEVSWAWVMRHDAVNVVTLTLPPDFGASLGALESSADRNDRKEFGRQASRLDAVVFEPVEPLLEGVTRLAIIPHGAFTRVPFGALETDARGGRTPARYRISIAPTLAAALKPEEARQTTERAYVIAASATTELPALRNADDEARAVASLYRNSRLDIGKDASPEAMVEALRSGSIVHVAAHTVLNPRRPLLSGFLLAGDRTLRALDLRGIDRISARAVILTSCSGGKAIPGRTFASPTLAKMLTAAGVPIVVGSYFDWDDASAATTGRLIHESLSQGRGAVEVVNRIAESLADTSTATLFIQASIFEP